MGVFVLHAGQPELSPFLRLLRVPTGTMQPKTNEGIGAPRWAVLSLLGPSPALTEEQEIVPGASMLLQPALAVRWAMNPRARTKLLRMHGIQAAEPSRVHQLGAVQKLARTYTIPVFQLEALGVFTEGGVNRPIARSAPRGVQLVPADSESAAAEGQRLTAVRRAERAAVRAVYALGLDYAVVQVSSDAAGFPVIETLDPSTDALCGIFKSVYADAIHRLHDQLERENVSAGNATGVGEGTLLLGMDPEFVLRKPVNGGKIVSASRYFARKGRVGCDGVRVGDRLLFPLAEFRPLPAHEPEDLIRNLYRAMRLAASRIDDASLEWLAGGMPAKGLPLGGHIHVSGVSLNADLLRAMDNYMALPLVLLEDSTTGLRRPRYGALGDFRRQFHGGFEYRTLPSWIVSPSVALGVVSLAKVVCEHYRELKERPLARPEIQRLYYAGHKQKLRPIVLSLWSDLERTGGYTRYRKALDRLKRKISRMEAWNEQQDVRTAWKIPTIRM